MRNKTQKLIEFLENLHNYIINDDQFRKKTQNKKETFIQAEIRPIIINFLTEYFENSGYKDAKGKANNSFYWGGQEGKYGKQRKTTFDSRNYPDFIIEEPYLIAIEYKRSDNGSVVKQGIGQSIIHTLSGDFDFVYYLFHDQTKDKSIKSSLNLPIEKSIKERIWDDFNVFLKIV